MASKRRSHLRASDHRWWEDPPRNRALITAGIVVLLGAVIYSCGGALGAPRENNPWELLPWLAPKEVPAAPITAPHVAPNSPQAHHPPQPPQTAPAASGDAAAPAPAKRARPQVQSKPTARKAPRKEAPRQKTSSRWEARDPTLPDPVLTPGQVTGMLTAEICARKWGKDRRYVSPGMKLEVFARYGLAGNVPTDWCGRDAHGRVFEIDHLASRELGGADTLINLWPQCYSGPFNATMKDRLENRLHAEVCAANIPLEQAQQRITRDWTTVYRKYFGEPQAGRK